MEIQRIDPPGLASSTFGSQAVRVGDTVFIAGQIAVDTDGVTVGAGDADAQTARVFEALGLAAEAAGGGIGDLAKITAYLRRPEYFGAIARGRELYLPVRDGARPAASTTVMIPACANPHALLQVEAIAVVGQSAASHRSIDPEKLPKGPGHPHGAIAGRTVYATGVMARRFGQILGKGDAAIQARLAFEQMEYVFESVGARRSDIVKHTTYFTHPSYYEPINQVESEIYSEAPPAGVSVSVSSMGSGPDPVVEIDAIAVIGGSVKRVAMPSAAAWNGYSVAVIADGLAYISGQIASNSEGKIVGHGDIQAQLDQTFANLERALDAAGSDRASMAKTTLYLAHPAYVEPAQAAHKRFFGDHLPAATTIVVQGLPDPKWLVEIDGVAVAH